MTDLVKQLHEHINKSGIKNIAEFARDHIGCDPATLYNWIGSKNDPTLYYRRVIKKYLSKQGVDYDMVNGN